MRETIRESSPATNLVFSRVSGEFINNSNFAHRFSLCTLKIQYWQLFSYLNSYAMLLEAVSSV
ncbi:hypothetical protein, partial [Roseburia sp. 1XD42-69]|uniref:hypothetical protein n=1 Tax=Roseburia sp. 1XD42-69 TaxID=2320088 RepID=UPI000EB92008